MSEMAPEHEGEGLLAYRLGRVEKLMEQTQEDSRARDDAVVKKLDEFIGQFNNTYAPEVLGLKYRVDQLERFRKGTIGALGAIALIVLSLVLNLIVRLVP